MPAGFDSVDDVGIAVVPDKSVVVGLWDADELTVRSPTSALVSVFPKSCQITESIHVAHQFSHLSPGRGVSVARNVLQLWSRRGAVAVSLPKSSSNVVAFAESQQGSK